MPDLTKAAGARPRVILCALATLLASCQTAPTLWPRAAVPAAASVRGRNRCPRPLDRRRNDARAEGRADHPGRHSIGHARRCPPLLSRLDPQWRRRLAGHEHARQRRRLAEAGGRILPRVDVDRHGGQGAGDVGHRRGPRPQQCLWRDALPAQYRARRRARSGADGADRPGDRRAGSRDWHHLGVRADPGRRAEPALGPHLRKLQQRSRRGSRLCAKRWSAGCRVSWARPLRCSRRPSTGSATAAPSTARTRAKPRPARPTSIAPTPPAITARSPPTFRR